MKNRPGGCVHHFLHHHSIAARIGEDGSAEAQDDLGNWRENEHVAWMVVAVLVQRAETDRKPLHGEQGKEKGKYGACRCIERGVDAEAHE